MVQRVLARSSSSPEPKSPSFHRNPTTALLRAPRPRSTALQQRAHLGRPVEAFSRARLAAPFISTSKPSDCLVQPSASLRRPVQPFKWHQQMRQQMHCRCTCCATTRASGLISPSLDSGCLECAVTGNSQLCFLGGWISDRSADGTSRGLEHWIKQVASWRQLHPLSYRTS